MGGQRSRRQAVTALISKPKWPASAAGWKCGRPHCFRHTDQHPRGQTPHTHTWCTPKVGRFRTWRAQATQISVEFDCVQLKTRLNTRMYPSRRHPLAAAAAAASACCLRSFANWGSSRGSSPSASPTCGDWRGGGMLRGLVQPVLRAAPPCMYMHGLAHCGSRGSLPSCSWVGRRAHGGAGGRWGTLGDAAPSAGAQVRCVHTCAGAADAPTRGGRWCEPWLCMRVQRGRVP